VPGGELGQDLAVLAADGREEAEPGHDQGEQQQLRQDHPRSGAAAAGGDHLVEHALAEQQDHGQAGPVDRLDGQDGQELTPPGGPDEPDRLAAQLGQPPQRPLHLRRLVDVGPGDPAGDVARRVAGGGLAACRAVATGRGVAAHGLLAHG
jgi:hypothetical protein